MNPSRLFPHLQRFTSLFIITSLLLTTDCDSMALCDTVDDDDVEDTEEMPTPDPDPGPSGTLDPDDDETQKNRALRTQLLQAQQ